MIRLWTLLAAQEDTVEVTVTEPTGAADYISLALTFALVVVTIIYVKHTSDMVDEMKEQRLADMRQRRREKSDRAAYACYEVVREVTYEMTRRGPLAVERSALEIAHATLRGQGPLITDEDTRKKIAACAEVLFVGTFSREQMDREDLSPGMVSVGVMEMVRATRWVLENYLAERDQRGDPWARSNQDGCGEQLPYPSNAAAWIRCVGRSS